MILLKIYELKFDFILDPAVAQEVALEAKVEVAQDLVLDLDQVSFTIL
jgi:hypothetical protein